MQPTHNCCKIFAVVTPTFSFKCAAIFEYCYCRCCYHSVHHFVVTLYSTDFITIRASVVNNIPTCITMGDLSEIKQTPAFSSLQLEDPEYSSRSQLDLLLRIAHCNICSLNGTVFSVDKTYKAEKTIFGWAIGGVSSANEQASTCMKLIPM